jgi:hypothetical protein
MTVAKGLCIDCATPITEEALKLNQTGLWCVDCEYARRARITASTAEVTKSFERPDNQGEGERHG